MREKHTPGPWKAGKGVEDDETRCFVTQDIEGKPPFLIAEIQNGAPGDCLETEEANARLIAAAPDLLNALKVLVLTPHIVAYLKANDPKSLEQLQKAIHRAEPPPESAQPCGCDPGANWRCSDYPNCAAGRAVRS